MTASLVDVAYDYELWIGREDDVTPGTYNWTQILGIETLPFPEQVPEDIDATHMQSANRTRESIVGLLPSIDATMEKQFWDGHAGDTLLNTLAELSAAGTPEDVKIEFNTGGATPAVRRTYRGQIRAFTPNGAVGEKAMVSVAMKIFEKYATNDRVIA